MNPVITKLAEGLDTVDQEHVNNLVEKFGLYGAARILGYDVSHYNNLLMSGRLAIEDLKSRAPKSILEYAEVFKKRLNKTVYNYLIQHHEELQKAINQNENLDYDHDWFSANTMITTYSANLEYNGKGMETPQQTWMRVAVQLYNDESVERVIECYREMAEGWYTPASPTIFNAGFREPQMSSCFVKNTKVITRRGPVPIQDIKIGDYVITHNQRWMPVTQVHENELADRSLIKLSLFGTVPFTVTDNHRLLACKLKENPQWISVEDLTTDHYIALGNLKSSTENKIVLGYNEILFRARDLADDLLEDFENIYKWSVGTIRSIILTAQQKFNLKKIGPECASTFYYVTRMNGILMCDPEGNFYTSEDLRNSIELTNGDVFVKVLNKEIVESKNNEKVYTLGVEQDHSYCVEGIMAENCFLITLGDDLKKILKMGVLVGGMISKNKGGLGFDISRVRHSEIAEIGMSSGIIPMLQVINYNVRYVNQGGARKGAATIFLRPHHLDAEEFVESTRKVGDKNLRLHDLNTCLWTPWIFWERIKNNGKWTLFCPAVTPQLNDVYGEEFTRLYIEAENDPNIKPHHKKVINARDFFNKILSVQRESGMPYLMNGDAANLKSNHRHLGYIRSSNLCVAGETPILTRTGFHPIESLKDQTVDVWNGTEWSTVEIKQTSKLRHLITVFFSNGRSLTCTPDHKFIVGSGKLKEAKRVQAQYLYPGLRLRDVDEYPGIESLQDFPHAYIHGALSIFGCFTDDGSPKLDIVGEVNNHLSQYAWGKLPTDLPAPYKVPVNYSINSKLKWLAGILDARSFVSNDGVLLLHINYNLLQDIQLMLYTLNVKSYFKSGEIVKVPMPNGKYVETCNHALFVPWSGISKLKELGFECKYTQEFIPDCTVDRDLTVVEIIDIGRCDATYCFTEHKNNAGIFNGILTGQCLEIIEYTDDETIAVCNLHSLSARMFTTTNNGVTEVNYDKLGYMTGRAIENLNKVIDFNWYPLDKMIDGVLHPKMINKGNKRHRPVGLGLSGWAELLHILDLPFEDPKVVLLNKKFFGCMYFNALCQSVQLAIRDGQYESFPGSPTSQGLLQFDLWKEEFKILGPNNVRKAEDDEPLDPKEWQQKPFALSNGDVIQPSWNDIKRCIMKYGLRNSLLIALMPTASTAQIRRNCETVEAHQNNLYSRKVLKCSYPVLNRYLVKDLEEIGLWDNTVVEYLKVKNGSIQGYCDFILNKNPIFEHVARLKHIEEKYKTMWEIKQKVFMNLAADRGRYIDQSASSNVYMKDCTDENLKACHQYANMLGLKTIMYYLRQVGGDAIKFTADPDMISHIKGLDVTVEDDNKKDKFVCTDEVCTACQ